MRLTVLNSFGLLVQKLDRVSLLDTGLFVLFTSFVAYGSAVTSFTLIYRLSPFHPAREVSRTSNCKNIQIMGGISLCQGDMYRLYKSLHDHYGDVVRVGPNELSIRDSSLIHPILGQGGLPKGPRWEGREGPPMLIAQRDPILHMHQRKSWSRAFSSVALKEYEIIVAKRVRQLVGCLDDVIQRSDQKANAVVDMTRWSKYFTTDFMGDMAFGGGFEIMKAGRDIDGIWTLLESGICISGVTSHIPYVGPILTAVAGQRSSLVRLRAFCKERALARLRMGPNRKDLFYYLSGEELPESERPSPADVAKDGFLAIIAGSDTTSSVLTAVLYYLLCNPAAYERLQAEVDGAFPSGEEPLDATKLTNLQGLIFTATNSNETLRLQPPVPSGSQRRVDKGKGAKVLGNLIIPEETQLYLHTYSIHRDPRNFHTPEAFLPERWLNTAPAGEHNTAAFFPFSYGPTNCVGKYLALMEMRMVLCWVLRRFQFSKAAGVIYEEWEGRILDWFIVHQDPLLVGVSHRE
ncbi:high nitrogen upregulated cytochrome P450 monooxygenase 2 [Lactarius vividus]|nr:high nitrogen upregulated cytochrome P450 monooxygenase 2 [Lactarius vividus]